MTPWDQQHGEPDEAYVRFLFFRNIGPTRTILAAWQLWVKARAEKTRAKTKRKTAAQTHPSGTWSDDAATWRWIERARAWDIAMLREVVPETATLIFSAIREMARITLEELASGRMRPTTWEEVKESAVVLSQFIAPETITAVVNHAQDDGANSDGDDDASESNDVAKQA
jgi:hypothetical protein